MSRLKPTYMFEKIEKIPFELLEKNKIKGVILDADNTIIDYRKRLSDEKKEWIAEAKKRGFSICILSNATSERKIRDLMQELDVNGLYCATKPFLRGFNMAKVLLDLEKEELVMIGDQIFTDIYGANRFGIKSIWVEPISAIEGPFTKIKRPVENLIIKIIKGNEKRKNKNNNK